MNISGAIPANLGRSAGGYDDTEAAPRVTLGAMNLIASMGTPVSTIRRRPASSNHVEKPELATAVSPPRKPDGRRVGATELARVYSFSILPADLAWLKAQPGGASKAIRRLVEAARAAEH